MKGTIYSEEKCPICGASFKHIENRGLFCPNHPNISPLNYRVSFKHQRIRIKPRFKEYWRAYKFLIGLRTRVEKGDYDARDFQRSQPLGFTGLASRWLEIKETQVSASHHRNLKNYIMKAMDEWSQTNVKTIKYAQIEDFLLKQAQSGLSMKTVSNIRSALNDFWSWLLRRHELRPDQMPVIPDIPYQLGYRKLITKETQQAILSEVKRISWDRDPKIWLGIRWLTIYVGLRPDDLRRLKEEDINLEVGCLMIERPTKFKTRKEIPLLEGDIRLIRELRGDTPVMPHLSFFRHATGHGGVQPGSLYGPNFFSKWWRKACRNLGIEGVDLYGGTRHSSAWALGEKFTPEEVKGAMILSTNRAFERYFGLKKKKILGVYEEADIKEEKGKVIKFKAD